MKNIKETIAVTFMGIMFWGILYPQFSLTQDTYLCLENQVKNPEKDFLRILNAKRGEVIIKSKLWESLKKETENIFTKETKNTSAREVGNRFVREAENASAREAGNTSAKEAKNISAKETRINP